MSLGLPLLSNQGQNSRGAKIRNDITLLLASSVNSGSTCLVSFGGVLPEFTLRSKDRKLHRFRGGTQTKRGKQRHRQRHFGNWAWIVLGQMRKIPIDMMYSSQNGPKHFSASFLRTFDRTQMSAYVQQFSVTAVHACSFRVCRAHSSVTKP